MHINHQVVVFDAADLTAESSFWAEVLEGTVDAEDDWHMVIVDGDPRVGVQLAPDHVPPDWPDGAPQQQIHLDLSVDDFTAALGRVMSLGAKVLKTAEDGSHPTTSRSTPIPPGIRSACVGFNDASSSRTLKSLASAPHHQITPPGSSSTDRRRPLRLHGPSRPDD